MSEIRFWRAVSSLIFLGFVLVFLFHVWVILLPFIFGLVIAYLIHPIMDGFVAMGLKRVRVVVVLYVMLLTAGVILAFWLLPALYNEINATMSKVPSYARALNGFVDQLNIEIKENLGRIIGSRAEVLAINFRADDFLQDMFFKLPQNILSFFHAGLWIVIVPFVSFFGLSHGRKWIDVIFSLTPSEYVESLMGLLAELNATLGGFLRGVLMESICVGFLTMVGLLFMGVEGAILIGIVTGIVNFVPFLAPIIGGGLALSSAYFNQASLSVLFGICILFTVIRLFDDFVLIPFVVGSSVQMHPVWTLFAILAGVELGGFVGLVFAIPVAVIVKVFLSISLRSRRESFIGRQQNVYS